MTNLLRFRTVLAAAALLAGTAACNKDKTGKQSDYHADRVNEKSDDLREESREVTETANNRAEALREKAADEAKDTADEVKDVAENAAERASERNADTREDIDDLVEEAREDREAVREKARDGARDVAAEAKDVGKHAHDLKWAQDDFEYARSVRVVTLRGVQSVASTQPMLIDALAANAPIVDGDRAQVQEKLQIFQMRLDEAGNQIQALQGVPAASWEQRHDDVKKAMSRLEDAREDAWEALDDADRLDRTSMR